MSLKALIMSLKARCVCVRALPIPKAGLYLTVGVVALPLLVVQVTWNDRATESRDRWARTQNRFWTEAGFGT